jgi:hypothetical protein
MNGATPFWLRKTLRDMTEAEWESLCDGCGKCCLHKLEDEDSGEVHYTRVACRLLDRNSGRCRDYAHRFRRVPECLDIRSLEPADYHWLPATCAYRLVASGQDLPDWHHLKSGCRDLVHRSICTVRGRTVCETEIPEEQFIDEIVLWADD